jgi:hypothetical protein
VYGWFVLELNIWLWKHANGFKSFCNLVGLENLIIYLGGLSKCCTFTLLWQSIFILFSSYVPILFPIVYHYLCQCQILILIIINIMDMKRHKLIWLFKSMLVGEEKEQDSYKDKRYLLWKEEVITKEEEEVIRLGIR